MSQGESSVVEWRLSNFILQLAKDSLSFFPGQECKCIRKYCLAHGSIQVESCQLIDDLVNLKSSVGRFTPSEATG